MNPASHVCLLHVGGTIGMVHADGGYRTQAGFLQTYLQGMPELTRGAVPRFTLVQCDPLMDSADMRPADWVRVARLIVERYDDYDGFVVVHGTDTMAYTASALSFLLHGLAKPVVLTGAQLSLEHVRSDGREHLITSLIIAGNLDIPEVCVYFGSQLLRGNRCQKIRNNAFIAFSSGNLPPLATVGVDIDVNWPLVLRPQPRGTGVVDLVCEPQVIAARVFPGMQASTLSRLLSRPTDGVVLETYGSGTFPSADLTLLGCIEEASARGVVIVNCSQCHSGRVEPGRYATSQPLVDRGVVSGGDMTPEAALTKLYCLLAATMTPEIVRQRMTENLAGELTVGT